MCIRDRFIDTDASQITRAITQATTLAVYIMMLTYFFIQFVLQPCMLYRLRRVWFRTACTNQSNQSLCDNGHNRHGDHESWCAHVNHSDGCADGVIGMQGRKHQVPCHGSVSYTHLDVYKRQG